MTRAELEWIRRQAECKFKDDPIAAAMIEQQAEYVRQKLNQTQQDVENLSVIAPVAGRIIDCDAVPRVGRFVKEGEWVATIASGGWVVRSLATAEDLADAKPHVGQKVRVRLISNVGQEYSGTVSDVAVVGSQKIAAATLTQLGGGTIAVAPDAMTAGEPFFEIEITLDGARSDSIRNGMTAYVSFQAHQHHTIGDRLYRSALRFLNKLRT